VFAAPLPYACNTLNSSRPPLFRLPYNLPYSDAMHFSFFDTTPSAWTMSTAEPLSWSRGFRGREGRDTLAAAETA